MTLPRLAFLAGCLAFLAGCAPKAREASVGEGPIMKDVSASDFQALLSAKPEALLLDVRTPEEWQEGYLEGAVHHDYWGDERLFALTMDAIPRDQPVLVYCAGGGRSGLTAKELIQAGHQEVYNLENGITGWIEAGLPIVQDPQP